jgi:hypothetical protein
LREVARVGPGADLLARVVEHRARSVDRERVVGASGELVDGREVAQLHEMQDTSRKDRLEPGRWRFATGRRAGSSSVEGMSANLPALSNPAPAGRAAEVDRRRPELLHCSA